MSTPSYTLRDLVKKFEAGKLDQPAYLQQRNDLIDAITTGEQPLVAYRPPPPPAPKPKENIVGDDTIEFEMPGVALERQKKKRRVIVVSSLVAIAVFIAVYLATNAARDPPQSATEASPAIIAPVKTANQMTQLIEAFISRNAWARDDMDRLISQWKSLRLTGDNLDLASKPLAQLGGKIRTRIIEQQVLFELDHKAEPLETQRRYFELAAALNIQSDRLDRLQTRWLNAWDQWQALSAADTPDKPFEVTPTPVTSVAETPSTVETVPELTNIEAFESPVETKIILPAVTPPNKRITPLANPLAAPIKVTTKSVATLPVPNTPTAPTINSPTSKPKQIAAIAPNKKPAAKKTKGNCRANLAKQRRPYCRDYFYSGAKGPAMVAIPAGQFQMGSDRGNESPRHEVSIDYPFAIGIYEVSFAEFKVFCSSQGRACPLRPWPSDKHPVVNVTWQDALDFTQWLSQETGATYRLPSEAEWEYAARSGITTPYPSGDELLPTHARFSYRRRQQLPLAANDRSINGNEFKLYHTLGNVREWVLDHWTENYNGANTNGSAHIQADSHEHPVRGGSFRDGQERVRYAARVRLAASDSDSFTGFRVLRELK